MQKLVSVPRMSAKEVTTISQNQNPSHCPPLLVGKVAFGRPSSKHVPPYRNGLVQRKVATFEETDSAGVQNLIVMVRQGEHPLLVQK